MHHLQIPSISSGEQAQPLYDVKSFEVHIVALVLLLFAHTFFIKTQLLGPTYPTRAVLFHAVVDHSPCIYIFS